MSKLTTPPKMCAGLTRVTAEVPKPEEDSEEEDEEEDDEVAESQDTGPRARLRGV